MFSLKNKKIIIFFNYNHLISSCNITCETLGPCQLHVPDRALEVTTNCGGFNQKYKKVGCLSFSKIDR